MDEIILAQGPSPTRADVGDLVHEVRAPTSGPIASIDCLQIAAIARLAGAPTDPGAGIDLLKKTGEPVKAGDVLYRIHGSEPSEFGFAADAAGEDCGVRVAG